MPSTPSAQKSLRQNEVKRMRNRSAKSALRTQLRKANEAIESGSGDVVQQVRLAMSKVDKAAKKNLIHKNKAARMKSKLSKAVSARAGE